MRRPLLRSGLLTVAAAATLTGATGAAAQTPTTAGSETKSAAGVTATLSWEGSDYGVKSVRLKIARDSDGFVGFDATIPDVCPDECALLEGADHLRVLDLDGDGSMEVTAEGFSNGAHCCIALGVYSTQPDGTYRQLVRNFGSYGYRLHDLGKDGRLEIDASDERFEDRFTSHAASFPPPRVFRFERTAAGTGRLRDVTRSFPAVIRKNAADALKLIRGKEIPVDQGERAGVMSAYVADQYLLKQAKRGLAELDRAIKRRLLGTTKQGRAFRARLLRVLHAYKYR